MDSGSDHVGVGVPVSDHIFQWDILWPPLYFHGSSPDNPTREGWLLVAIETLADHGVNSVRSNENIGLVSCGRTGGISDNMANSDTHTGLISFITRKFAVKFDSVLSDPGDQFLVEKELQLSPMETILLVIVARIKTHLVQEKIPTVMRDDGRKATQ